MRMITAGRLTADTSFGGRSCHPAATWALARNGEDIAAKEAPVGPKRARTSVTGPSPCRVGSGVPVCDAASAHLTGICANYGKFRGAVTVSELA